MSKHEAREKFDIAHGVPGSAKLLRNKMATLEHVVPRSIGGKNSKKNYKIACHECNTKRGAPDIHSCYERFVS